MEKLHLGGLTILARQNALTEKDWFELLEARRKLIEKHLRDMTLKSLGELRFIHDYFHEHALKMDEPKLIGDTRFTLDTRGIFPSDKGSAGVTNTEYHHTPETLARSLTGGSSLVSTTERLWGFTRNGKWIGVEVFVTRSEQPYKYEGRTEEVARAETVSIQEYPLAV